MGSDTSEPSACPVDHKTRDAWLRQANSQSSPASSSPLPTASGQSCDSSQIDQASPSSRLRLPLPGYWSSASPSLGTSREVSTIPRAEFSSSQNESPSRPANNEADTGADKKSGNWIYPSEQMFFAAMKRKNYDPRADDMRSIVPIHNAVNERAWKEIKEWEKGQGAEKYESLRRFFLQDDSLGADILTLWQVRRSSFSIFQRPQSKPNTSGAVIYINRLPTAI